MFVGILSFSAAVVHNVQIGLDQALSMPDVSVKIRALLSSSRLPQSLNIFCAQH